MDTNHTPLPWQYNGYDDHCDVGRKYHEIVDETGFEVINQNGILDGQGEEGAANAQRIVACVNAMEGIENPEEFVRQGRAADELLEAIKPLVDIAHHAPGGHGYAIDMGREAIAKAMGNTDG